MENLVIVSSDKRCPTCRKQVLRLVRYFVVVLEKTENATCPHCGRNNSDLFES